MDSYWSSAIWKQFGAAIDMLEGALRACPDKLWNARLWSNSSREPEGEFWYVLFDVLFYLDFYLSGKEEGFVLQAPFKFVGAEPEQHPERMYTKDELLAYLAQGRAKCKSTLLSLTDEQARQPCGFYWLKLSIGELHLYNMRHVQEHGAQLNMFLGQQIGFSADWVSQAQTMNNAGESI
jgi:hypothetical protein